MTTQADVMKHPLATMTVEAKTEWEKIARLLDARNKFLIAWLDKYLVSDDLDIDDLTDMLKLYKHVVGTQHMELDKVKTPVKRGRGRPRKEG